MFPNVVALFDVDLEAEHKKAQQQRKKISTASASQFLTDEALSAFSRLLSKAKKAMTEACAAEARVFRALEDMCIDAYTAESKGAPLAAVIDSYLAYDTFSHKEIMATVRELYSKEVDNE